MKVAILPYEDNIEFARGTSLGWWNIRLGLDSIEEYSPYQKIPVPYTAFEEFVVTAPVGLTGKEWVDHAFNKLDSQEDIKLFIGGNHLISLPALMWVKKRFPDVHIVHLDAHLDRRDTYLGSKYNYATVFRRIEELIGPEHITTLGWRSIEPKEETYSQVKIPDEGPLYLSLDMDWFDPSVFGCVTNPEPGGGSFKEFLRLLGRIKNRLVAADVVEYNPLEGPRGCAAFAAVVIREIAAVLL